ncbi:MAG: WG repeat-containing protein, partial [Bacteroidaceae bacterium]|nr:WG repeat-containing protein [Bacteroidaceae bacterium]
MKNNHLYLYLLALTLLTACQLNQRNTSVSPKILEIRSYCEGVALANAENGLWGYVDEKQQWVIEPQYRYA